MRLISKTNSVTPHFFAFLASFKKKSVRGNILGANVLNSKSK